MAALGRKRTFLGLKVEVKAARSACQKFLHPWKPVLHLGFHCRFGTNLVRPAKPDGVMQNDRATAVCKTQSSEVAYGPRDVRAKIYQGKHVQETPCLAHSLKWWTTDNGCKAPMARGTSKEVWPLLAV